MSERTHGWHVLSVMALMAAEAVTEVTDLSLWQSLIIQTFRPFRVLIDC